MTQGEKDRTRHDRRAGDRRNGMAPRNPACALPRSLRRRRRSLKRPCPWMACLRGRVIWRTGFQSPIPRLRAGFVKRIGSSAPRPSRPVLAPCCMPSPCRVIRRCPASRPHPALRLPGPSRLAPSCLRHKRMALPRSAPPVSRQAVLAGPPCGLLWMRRSRIQAAPESEDIMSATQGNGLTRL